MIKSLKISIIYLVITISLLIGQNRATDYEYFFQTKNVLPITTTVTFKVQNSNSPIWDEYKYVTSGTETVYRYITGNQDSCFSPPSPNDIDQGGGEYPSIGYAKHKIEVTNSGKNAYFWIESTGQLFQGDKYFTYDYDGDQFYMGGGCRSYGTTPISNGSTIIISADNGSGNLDFQPTNPTGLSVTSYNNHPKLTWTASKPSFSTIKYKVHRKPHLGSWIQIRSNISSTTYIDWEINTSSAQKRTRYWYRVSAYTDKSSPGYSNEVLIYGYRDYKIGVDIDLIKIKDEITEQVNINSFTINGFPNPFNPLVTIQYSIPEKSTINIDIYNIEGRLIKTLIQREQNPGVYKINWDASNMPSGMYIAKLLSTTGIELSQKILLSK